jgi:hypothetical protein
MSSVPAFLVCQFHGRFVFAEDKARKELTVLAVDPRKHPRISSERHDPFLAIREANVNRKGPQGKREKPPAHRVTSTSPSPFDGARLLWDIADCKIDVESGGGFEWLPTGGGVLPIADLGLSGRPFNRQYLDAPRPTPPTTAIVTIHSGVGFGFHEFGKELSVFDYDYVQYGDSTEQVVASAGFLCDMVAVAMQMSTPYVDLSFNANEGISIPFDPLRLSQATVRGKTVPAVILNFSNLCTAAESRTKDTEFAAYYDVLEQPPELKLRWIPKLRKVYSPTNTTIETLGHPFGDCYLSAKVSY